MAVILVVEDEVFTRELAGMCMEDNGHAVLFAGNVAEAIKHLKSGSVIDALFTDIYLEKAIFGGCEVADEGMQLRPGLRVLYTTGNAATLQLQARFVRGSHFLSKPYTPAQLQTSVDDMLDK
jgi:CheY-like chemotaxis protein